jgi:CheY-like chemotaxis protein
MMRKFSTVMIIDDSEMDNLFLKVVLETIGYSDKILSYTNPALALSHLKNIEANEASKKEIPEIIFLDINMPIMNGFDFLEEFNKLPAYITRPAMFYMISSSEDADDMEKIKEYKNVIKYLYKPLDKNELI